LFYPHKKGRFWGQAGVRFWGHAAVKNVAATTPILIGTSLQIA